MACSGGNKDSNDLQSWRRPTARRASTGLMAATLVGTAMLTTPARTQALGFSPDEQARIERLVEQTMNGAGAASASPDTRHDHAFTPGPSSDLLRINLSLQTRFVANSGANGADGNSDDWESGFNIARTRLMIRGEHPDLPLSYYFAGDFTPGGDAMERIDAYITWRVDDVWQLRFGQFKGPLVRESDMVSSMRSLFADSSIVARVFRLNYLQGIQLMGTGERVRGLFAFTDGRGSANTGFTDDRVAEAAMTARGEWRFGEASWGQYSDMTAFRDAPTGALLGVAGHWQQGGATTGPASLGEHANLWAGTADLSIEGDGWNAMASLVGRVVEGRDESLSELGVMVQGGAFVTERVELLGRYAHVFPDSDRGDNADDFAACTVGMNYYLLPKSHAAKLTAELTWYPTAQGDSSALISPSDTIGLLHDSDDEQWAFVLQMQLMF